MFQKYFTLSAFPGMYYADYNWNSFKNTKCCCHILKHPLLSQGLTSSCISLIQVCSKKLKHSSFLLKQFMTEYIYTLVRNSCPWLVTLFVLSHFQNSLLLSLLGMHYIISAFWCTSLHCVWFLPCGCVLPFTCILIDNFALCTSLSKSGCGIKNFVHFVNKMKSRCFKSALLCHISRYLPCRLQLKLI